MTGPELDQNSYYAVPLHNFRESFGNAKNSWEKFMQQTFSLQSCFIDTQGLALGYYAKSPLGLSQYIGDGVLPSLFW